MDEDGIQSCSSQYIEMDLAMMHRNGWDCSPRIRKMQKPLESREFEFTIAEKHSTDVYRQSSLHLVPADELFFRGKLLPLHPDHRLRLLQALTCLNERDLDDEEEDDEEEEEEEDVFAMETEKLFNPMSANVVDDTPEESADTCAENGSESFFSLHCAYRLSSVHVLASSAAAAASETEESLKRNDSGSSSFRSQQSSNYWSSYGEKESRDSMSSSRYSDGSSQDAYPSISLHHNHHHHHHHHHDISMPPSLSSLLCSVTPNAMVHDKGIPPKAKKWSWKVLLGGFRTASKVIKLTSVARTLGNGYADGERKSTTVEGHRSFFPDHINSDRKKQKDRSRHSTASEYARQSDRSAKETWLKYVNKVKRPLVQIDGSRIFNVKNKESNRIKMREESRSGLIVEAKKMNSLLSSKQMMKRSAERKPEEGRGRETRMGYGIITSCPASMASSPNHSGILAAINNKNNNSPSLGELHNAIQSAITHCKQSQQQTPATVDRPSEY